MKFDPVELLSRVDNQEFQELFVDLGWSRPEKKPNLQFNREPQGDGDETNVVASRIALMSSVSVWHCDVEYKTEDDNYLPINVGIMDWTNGQLSKYSTERILIFTSRENPETQIWVWADKKRAGGYTRRKIEHEIGSNNVDLFQRLEGIYFGPKQQNLGSLEIIQRVRRIFDSEKVTTRFYKDFKKNQEKLQQNINGLSNDEDRRWYSVLLLNRLMFIYFIQKKKFLDNNLDYLKTSLERVTELNGPNQFYNYYRDFLLPLFHKGLGGEERPIKPAEIQKIIGDVPYINGGIFMVHPIEAENKDIEIPDQAFLDIFDFLDKYQWHLDESRSDNPNEINPDILGHIFEQHTNQKQQGAYYTKEDITQYMCSKTIVPLFIDRLQNKLGNTEPGPWMLLKKSPKEFIPESLFYGQGEDDTRADFATWDGGRKQQEDFPNPLDPWLEEKQNNCKYRLAGETRREALERISWGQELEDSLQNGQVENTSECITLNLELTELAMSWIKQTNSPELLLTAWEELKNIRVLDPTVGSGAFLRSALDILEDLYEAIYERADSLLIKNELLKGSGVRGQGSGVRGQGSGVRGQGSGVRGQGSGVRGQGSGVRGQGSGVRGQGSYLELEQLVSEIEGIGNKTHNRSPSYFIRRTAILNNLYGNELNQEAAEICQLRLFLSLVAVLEDREQIEPLPDLDLNIRSGNLLVGAETIQDAIDQYSSTLYTQELVDELRKAQGELAKKHKQFTQAQHNNEIETTATLKDEIKDLSRVQHNTLDRLALISKNFGNEPTNAQLEQYRNTHRPFHWFVEFPEVMLEGGFDVVIGNPPFIKANNVRKEYDYSGFATDGCADIYAPCMERSARLLKDDGRFAMISPISLTSGLRFKTLRDVLAEELPKRWVAGFATRPDMLFKARVSPIISIGSAEKSLPDLHTSILRKWSSEYRAHLFETLRFALVVPSYRLKNVWPLIGLNKMSDFLNILEQSGKSIKDFEKKDGKYLVGHRKIISMRYLSAFLTEPPRWEEDCHKVGNRILVSENAEVPSVGWIPFDSQIHRDSAFLVLAGRIGHALWAMIGDAFHVTTSVVTWKAIDLNAFNVANKKFAEFAEKLDCEQRLNPSVDKNKGYIGNYNMGECRNVSDQSDKLILDTLGLSDFYATILLADNWLVKSTDSGSTTSRNWPKPWTPTHGPWSPDLDDPNNVVEPT